MAAFGGFTFTADEEPIADSGWSPGKAISDINTNLGAARDSVLTMGISGGRRVLEFYLTPARMAALAALMNTTANLTDWEAVPVVKLALLNACDCLDAVTGSYGTTAASRRVRIELIAQ